jgi:hypothetical protein
MPKKIIKDPNFVKPMRGTEIFKNVQDVQEEITRPARGPVKQTEEAKKKISQKQKETIARKNNINQLINFLMQKIELDDKKTRYFTKQERANIILNYLNKN